MPVVTYMCLCLCVSVRYRAEWCYDGGLMRSWLMSPACVIAYMMWLFASRAAAAVLVAVTVQGGKMDYVFSLILNIYD